MDTQGGISTKSMEAEGKREGPKSVCSDLTDRVEESEENPEVEMSFSMAVAYVADNRNPESHSSAMIQNDIKRSTNNRSSHMLPYKNASQTSVRLNRRVIEDPIALGPPDQSLSSIAHSPTINGRD